MIQIFAQSIRSLLLILALVLYATIAAPAAVGQPSAGQGLPIPADKAQTSSTPVAGPDLEIGDCSHPNYWIVSSRACPRDHGRCGFGCQLEYLHYNGCLHRSNREAFRASLQPNVPICIAIHGSYVSPSDVSHDSAYIYRWLRGAAPERPLHVVFYTWPSRGIFTFNRHNPLTSLSPQLDIAILGQRAEFNGLYLARLISTIPQGHPISLVGHSHGSRVAMSSLHLLGGGQIHRYYLSDQGNQSNPIRVVLAAAALDHDWLNPGQRYDRALCRAECVLNLKNRRDTALAFYPLRKPFGGRSLGRTGFTRKDRSRLGWMNPKAVEMDVSGIVGSTHQWPGYYRHAVLAASFVPFVYFSDSYTDEASAAAASHAAQ